MKPQENHTQIDTTDEAVNLQAVAQRQANKTITISSSEPLEITITRSGMEVSFIFNELLYFKEYKSTKYLLPKSNPQHGAQ